MRKPCFLVRNFLFFFIWVIYLGPVTYYQRPNAAVLQLRGSFLIFLKSSFSCNFELKLAITHWICRIFKIGQRHSISWVQNYRNQYQTRFLKIAPPLKKKRLFLKKLKRWGRIFSFDDYWGLMEYLCQFAARSDIVWCCYSHLKYANFSIFNFLKLRKLGFLVRNFLFCLFEYNIWV